MSLPKLASPIVGSPEVTDSPKAPSRFWATTAVQWKLLGEIGAVLAVVGGVDLALTWFPLAFSSPEWEFGTITATFDGLPVVALGLGLALASAHELGARRVRRVVRSIFGVLGIALIGAGLLYATVIPLALRSLSDPAVEIGLYRAIYKTAVQAIMYPALFLWIAFRR